MLDWLQHFWESDGEYMLRILLAAVMGGIIGTERSRRQKEAGIRTHVIVALGSALIMVVSKYGFFDLLTSYGIEADPSRLASNIVTGVSFLGAGVIFVKNASIRGLTTAAGIWATAGVGLACGAGMYGIAAFVTLLIIIVQLLMHRFSIGNDAFSNSEIRITVVDTPEIRAALKAKQKELGITIINSRITTCGDNTLNMILQVRMKDAIPFKDVMKFMDEHPEIKSLSV